MLLTHQTKPSLWGSLLWKDFQQVKLAFLVLVIAALCMQLMFLIIVWLTLDLDQWGPLVNSVFGIASATPIMLALACTGMLIGHERQSGNWSWSSSLPVFWWQALGSKLIVTTLGSLLVSLPLGVIPALLSTSQKLHAPYGDVSVAYYSLTLVIFLEVIVVCFLATVLMRETLGALLVAGLVLTVLHIFASLPWWHENNWISNRLGISLDSAPRFWFVFLSAFILALGFGLLVVAFRWRWTFGQQTNLAFWQERATSVVSGHFRYRESSGARPSEWWMMLVHSLRNNLGLGTCVLAIQSASMILLLKSVELSFLLFSSSMLALGVISFQSDQTLGRFRFLADRGVTPAKLVLSRLSIALVFAIPIYVTYSFVYLLAIPHLDSQPSWFVVGFFVCPFVFSSGALAAICFRKQVFIIGVAILVTVLGLILISTILSWVHFEEQLLTGNSYYDLDKRLFYCLPFVTVVNVIALFLQSRRWLILDQPKLELRFIGISIVAMLTPLFVLCTFGFLAIPNSSDIAMPSALDAANERMVPDYPSCSEPLLVDASSELIILSRHQSVPMQMIETSAYGILNSVRNEVKEIRDQSLSELLNPSLAKLQSIQDGPKVPASRSQQLQLESLIARTAALATVATKEEDANLALRLWKLNRDLQEVGSKVYPLETHAARKIAMYLLLTLKSTDVKVLGGGDVYRSLIPSPAEERSASIAESFAVERIRRQQLNSPVATSPMHWIAVTRYYPPMRWLYERRLVQHQRDRRSHLETLPTDYLTGEVRRQLEQRFQN
jgi:hypothetical protein